MIFISIENELKKWNSGKCALNKQLPSRENYSQGKIAVPQHLINKINEILEKSFYCVLLGEKDSGKTWLISLFYYSKISNNNNNNNNNNKSLKVKKFFSNNNNNYNNNIEFYYKKVDDEFDGNYAWKEISDSYINKTLDKKRYIILDDCHFNNKEANVFYNICINYTNVLKNNQKLKFIFLSRNNNFMENDEDPFCLINSRNNDNIYNIVAKSTKLDKMSFFKNIILKFIDVNDINYKQDSALDEEIKLLYDNLKNNLYLLTFWLYFWKQQANLKLSEIKLKDIYEVLWIQNGDVKLFVPERKKALLSLSLMCQFEEVFVWEDFIVFNKSLEIYNKLFKDGLIHYSQFSYNNYYYIDSDFAKMIINTVLLKDRDYFNNATLMPCECCSVFKDYLLFCDSIPNADYIFSSIIKTFLKTNAEKNNKYAKDLILLINENKKIKEKLIQYYILLNLNRFSVEMKRFKKIISKLSKSEFKDNNQTLDQLRSNQLEIIEQYKEKNKISMIDEIRNSNGSRVYDKLQKMAIFIDDLASFLQITTIDDYKKIINRGDYTDLFRLLKYFICKKDYSQNLYNESIKLLHAIDKETLSPMLLSDKLSLHRIAGVIVETKRYKVDNNGSNHCNYFIKLDLCNSFIIDSINILIEDDNLKVVCDNIEETRKNYLTNDISFVSNDVSTIYNLNQIINWLRNPEDTINKNDITELLDNFIKKSLELDWNNLIYIQNNPTKYDNGDRIKSLNRFMSTSLRTKEQRENLCTKICDENLLNIILDSEISFEVRFYLLWHIHLYTKTFDFSKIEKMFEYNNNLNLDLTENCSIFAIIGINYIHNKAKFVPLDMGNYFDQFKGCLDNLRAKKQPTLLILALISGRSFLSENEFLHLVTAFPDIDTLLERMQESSADQQEELINLKTEFISIR